MKTENEIRTEIKRLEKIRDDRFNNGSDVSPLTAAILKLQWVIRDD